MADAARNEAMMISLAELGSGQSAEVVDIRSEDGSRLLKLAGFGLVPGSRIRLQQRFPAYIVWIGETQVSLDGEVAREIVLRLTPDSAESERE